MLKDPRLTGTSDGSSSLSSSDSEGSSTVSVNEKMNKNKQKFLYPLSSLETPAALQNTLSPTEFNIDDMLKDLNMYDMLQDMKSQQAEWDDPVARQLYELLSNNLYATFSGAIKKIVESGYTGEEANLAVLNNGTPFGSKDVVSIVVDNALALLKKEKEIETSESAVFEFEGIESLVEYTLVEMVYMILNTRPASTIAEAMWSLLISDLNVLTALGEEGSSSRGSSVSSNSKIKVSGPKKTEIQKNLTPPQKSLPENPQISKSKSGESNGTGKESSQAVTMDGKLGGSKKGSSSKSERDILKQKVSQLDKIYRGRNMPNGVLKIKVSSWEFETMMLDKSMIQTRSSSVSVKGKNPNLPASKFPVKDKKSCLKGKLGILDPPKVIDYTAGIPYDETLQKHIPQDENDEMILTFLDHKQVLEKEIQGWSDWANEKILQATKRLGKDRAELKMLMQEKEDAGKLEKGRGASEESMMKRLNEMEYALSNAMGQIEVANSTVKRLEGVNSLLKKERETVDVQGTNKKLEEAVLREKEAKKKYQLMDKERSLLMEKLRDRKSETAEVASRKEKAKERQVQFKAHMKHEEKEKAKVTAQIDALRIKRQQEEALMKDEAKKIKQIAETNLRNCKEDIKVLQKTISELRLEANKSKTAALSEKTISELRLEANKSKITALSEGYGNGEGVKLLKNTRKVPAFQHNLPSTSVKAERECVMCMTEEISVVFLPCAHQIICGACSERHEKKGMKDCPSCRTMIVNRISVCYPAN